MSDGTSAARLLADTLRGYFWLCRCVVEWLAVAEAGLAAATRAGDLHAQAVSRLSLGDAHVTLGRLGNVIEHYTAALDLACRIGWVDGQAAILGSLGNAFWDLGALQKSADHHTAALTLYRRTGSRSGQANALNYVANAYLDMGALSKATGHCAEALRLYRQIGSRPGEANALTNLGEVDHARPARPGHPAPDLCPDPAPRGRRPLRRGLGHWQPRHGPS